MKRSLFVAALAVVLQSVYAQTEFDVVKYLEPNISGSARYSSMAGAFGALGGDPSAIKDNPAGLGIFRSSEISGSLGLLTNSISSKWLGVTSSEVSTNFSPNNLSFIISNAKNQGKKTGLQRSNWAFNYNKLNSFNREVRINGGSTTSSLSHYLGYFSGSISGDDLYFKDNSSYDPYNNTSASWLSVLAANADFILGGEDQDGKYWGSFLGAGETLTPSYNLVETGSFSQFLFSWSGNFSNRIFLGASINMYSQDYSAEAYYTEKYQTDKVSLGNYYNSEATGVGLKFGTILVPVDYLRLGLSLQTPVLYSVNDYNNAEIYYNGSKIGYTPTAETDFKIMSPIIYNLSAAFLMGNSGVIGIEYETADNSQSQLLDLDENDVLSGKNFREENDSINALFKSRSILKLGFEYKLNSNISLRAGYAIADPVTSDKLNKYMIPNTVRTDPEYFVKKGATYITGGLGYRESNWYVDFAVIHKTFEESFNPYNSKNLMSQFQIPSAKLTNTNLSFNATVGLKF
jgi:hypothetical protein